MNMKSKMCYMNPERRLEHALSLIGVGKNTEKHRIHVLVSSLESFAIHNNDNELQEQCEKVLCEIEEYYKMCEIKKYYENRKG